MPQCLMNITKLLHWPLYRRTRHHQPYLRPGHKIFPHASISIADIGLLIIIISLFSLSLHIDRQLILSNYYVPLSFNKFAVVNG